MLTPLGGESMFDINMAKLRVVMHRVPAHADQFQRLGQCQTARVQFHRQRSRLPGRRLHAAGHKIKQHLRSNLLRRCVNRNRGEHAQEKDIMDVRDPSNYATPFLPSQARPKTWACHAAKIWVCSAFLL
jgi:hypothetical protein